MGKSGCAPVQVFLSTERYYACGNCHAHLAEYESVVSKTFQGRFGRAFLVDSVVNVQVGSPSSRLLITGLHTVADVTCAVCNVIIGWRYISAADSSQKYKEGRFVLEKARIAKENGWSPPA